MPSSASISRKYCKARPTVPYTRIAIYGRRLVAKLSN